MKTLFFAAILTCMISSNDSAGQMVYICNNGKTEVYHVNQNCQGLNRCTHEIVKMTEGEARGSGKRLCGYED